MIKKLLLILLLTSIASGAQVIRYVDPDAVGGGTGLDWTNAYTSLQAWDVAEGTDLVSDSDYHTVNCRSSSGTDDTTFCFIHTNDWNTGVANYIEIIGNDFPADGIFDGTKYVRNVTNNYGLRSNVSYIRVHNIQFQVTATGSNNSFGYRTDATGANDIRIDSCIVKGVSSSTGIIRGIDTATSSTVSIYNTTFYDCVNGANASHYALYGEGSSTATAYNCTLYGNYLGVEEAGSSTVTVINCIVGNNVDDFDPAATISYCCSDDGDGANSQAPSGGSWDNEMNDPGNGDFTILTGANSKDNGTDDPSSGLYSDDIIDTARVSTWDIGAYEFAAPPPVGGGMGTIMKIILD